MNEWEKRKLFLNGSSCEIEQISCQPIYLLFEQLERKKDLETCKEDRLFGFHWRIQSLSANIRLTFLEKILRGD